MDDPSLDIRDQRRRLVRLAVSACVGVVVTVLSLRFMIATSRSPNADPIGSSSVGLLGIGIFVTTTTFMVSLLSRLAKSKQIR